MCAISIKWTNPEPSLLIHLSGCIYNKKKTLRKDAWTKLELIIARYSVHLLIWVHGTVSPFTHPYSKNSPIQRKHGCSLLIFTQNEEEMYPVQGHFFICTASMPLLSSEPWPRHHFTIHYISAPEWWLLFFILQTTLKHLNNPNGPIPELPRHC